ncbi:hypothetical protein VF14_27665 [Nostoc linckia z18]|uniref:Uncharacterized protein n=2 Tax=Nostoc linckia TaxID=92942 RepID=A0A9Q6EKY5_NOSLI|nr:hypothetical protein [Nostoc linckia]PHK35992.1 hypothetical protein VF12_21885 [Nostoc linckia z15]PHK43457.1 hypothetical protein VF13_27220 [Nostoc linckia z16]PHJ66989.1 hypothetical protein VF02_06680 [Nostoc linckia z1]PHJ67719.1 hypothetical protein VF05_17005 [Nostoc linckia z3]PHJ77251.1 hypothetical protein VF03_05240 [Nostoc linckia z2]
MKYQFLSLKRSIFETFQNPKYSRPALNNLDQKLEKYLNLTNGFFIEAGANVFFDEVNSFLKSSYQLVEKLSFHDYLYQIKE